MAAIWFDAFTFHRCCWIVYHWIDISILIDVLLHPCLVMLVIKKLYKNLWPLSTFKSRLCPLHATILFLFESTQRDTDGASSYVFWLVCVSFTLLVFSQKTALTCWRVSYWTEPHWGDLLSWWHSNRGLLIFWPLVSRFPCVVSLQWLSAAHSLKQ